MKNEKSIFSVSFLNMKTFVSRVGIIHFKQSPHQIH